MNESGGIVELLRSAKPLIFENTEAEWRYSIKGTCFMARFGFRCFAITAKHYKWVSLALAQGDENAKRVLPKIESRLSAAQIAEAQRIEPDVGDESLTSYH